MGRVERIDIGQHKAGPQHAQHGQHVGNAVRRLERNDVTLLKFQLFAQVACKVCRMPVDFGKGKGRTRAIRQRRRQERLLARPCCSLLHQCFDPSRDIFAQLRLERGGFRIVEVQDRLVFERNRRKLRYDRHNFSAPNGFGHVPY